MHDIFYVTTNNHKTDDNYQKLKKKFPITKLATSLAEAQNRCLSKFAWIVWDDLVVCDTFDFSYEPDSGSKSYIHVFLNDSLYDGIILVPKHATVTTKEIEHRFFINKKEVDVVASYPKPYDSFYIETYDDYKDAVEKSTTHLFWMITHNVIPDKLLLSSFYIPHHDSYLRKCNHAFLNNANGKTDSYGIFLLSKSKPVSKKEIEFKHIIDVENPNIVGSYQAKYDIFEINTYDDYVSALTKSKTEMFWGINKNISIDPEFKFDLYFSFDNFYDRHENHAFIHKVGDAVMYNGVFLFSKKTQLTPGEINAKAPVSRKEWQIVASRPVGYDIFNVKTYEDYLNAFTNASTEMFWIIPDNVEVNENFKFDTYFTHDQIYERSINHVYLNGFYYDGIVLCSKQSKISKREYDFMFISHKKEVNVLASTPKPYDVVFISYDEPNADENYEMLKQKVPNARRIHGVKGIHNAHIEAAKLCSSKMFWIVDGDAVIVDSFNFDYQVPVWEQETVHVWRSKNPINDLVYGYGGIKLFPTELTINMDVSKPDMTTSISSKFKTVNVISNITAFNTDPFNTWKSAFRECCKLSSKIIDRQQDVETNNRLKIWTTVGKDRQYGNYAVSGAKAGSVYGLKNKSNLTALYKINDYDWLKEQFNNENS